MVFPHWSFNLCYENSNSHMLLAAWGALIMEKSVLQVKTEIDRIENKISNTFNDCIQLCWHYTAVKSGFAGHAWHQLCCLCFYHLVRNTHEKMKLKNCVCACVQVDQSSHYFSALFLAISIICSVSGLTVISIQANVCAKCYTCDQTQDCGFTGWL